MLNFLRFFVCATAGLTDVSTELKCGKTDKFYLRPITGEIYLTQGCHTVEQTAVRDIPVLATCVGGRKVH